MKHGRSQTRFRDAVRGPRGGAGQGHRAHRLCDSGSLQNKSRMPSSSFCFCKRNSIFFFFWLAKTTTHVGLFHESGETQAFKEPGDLVRPRASCDTETQAHSGLGSTWAELSTSLSFSFLTKKKKKKMDDGKNNHHTGLLGSEAFATTSPPRELGTVQSPPDGGPAAQRGQAAPCSPRHAAGICAQRSQLPDP